MKFKFTHHVESDGGEIRWNEVTFEAPDRAFAEAEEAA